MIKFGSATSPWTFADLPGAGGIHATMRDMMRFAKAQLTPPTGTLGEAIELAWKQQRDADASGPAMGLGWVIRGRWSDSLAQRSDGWITCGNLHQSRVQVRGRCVVQHGRNQRNRSTGDAVDTESSRPGR